MVIAFGQSHHDLFSKIDRLDYSYGIYIYAFPVQQTVAHFFPEIGLFSYLVLTAVAIVPLAAISWYVIEKPALRLKPTAARL